MEEIKGITTIEKDSFCVQQQNRIIRDTIELINKKELNILQLGCNFIENSLLLTKNEKYKIILIDDKNETINSDKLNISKSSLTKTNFEDNTFDLTFNIDVINKTQDPLNIIKEMVRITRKYGMILLIFPGDFDIKKVIKDININLIDVKIPNRNHCFYLPRRFRASIPIKEKQGGCMFWFTFQTFKKSKALIANY